jgi:hypothetical protein
MAEDSCVKTSVVLKKPAFTSARWVSTRRISQFLTPELLWQVSTPKCWQLIQALANIEPITTARRPGANMISRTATTRLVVDILNPFDRPIRYPQNSYQILTSGIA